MCRVAQGQAVSFSGNEVSAQPDSDQVMEIRRRLPILLLYGTIDSYGISETVVDGFTSLASVLRNGALVVRTFQGAQD